MAPRLPQGRGVEQPAVERGVYVALGDSLAVGVGATDPARGGYVPRFFEFLRTESWTGITRLINLAVSGETSASLISGGQLERALRTLADEGPAVRVVTLDIGGNDLLWVAAGEPCASDPNSEACRRAVIGTLDRYQANFRAALARLVEAIERSGAARLLDDGARFFVLTYYNPFSGTGHELERAGDEALLGVDRTLDCVAAETNPDHRGINDIISCAAAALGAEAVDVYPSFVGRGDDLTLIGSGDVHANDAGYAAMADRLAEAYR